MRCLKACTAADTVPGSLCRCGRTPGKRPGCFATAKWVFFSHPLVSTPSSAPPQNSPRTVFLPSAETGGTNYVSTAAESTAPVDAAAESAAPADTAAVPATPADTASEDVPLTSSLPSRGQSSRGALWRAVLLASACTCVHAVSTYVHTPYIYAYVILNKLVL